MHSWKSEPPLSTAALPAAEQVALQSALATGSHSTVLAEAGCELPEGGTVPPVAGRGVAAGVAGVEVGVGAGSVGVGAGGVGVGAGAGVGVIGGAAERGHSSKSTDWKPDAKV